jgi:hypothetical protein
MQAFNMTLMIPPLREQLEVGGAASFSVAFPECQAGGRQRAVPCRMIAGGGHYAESTSIDRTL